MIKSFSAVLILFLVPVIAKTQILEPVKWSWKAEKIDDKEYELVFEAVMDKGWGVYSMYLESDQGPIATQLDFSESPTFTLKGKPTEDDEHKKEGFDPLFEMNVTKYLEQMIIRQRVLVTDPTQKIKGSITYMACDDEKCIFPPKVDFEIVLVENPQTPQLENTPEEPASIIDNQSLYGFSPTEITLAESSCVNEKEESAASSGLLNIFLLGMLGGILALLTPCVFPMIPLTVSFFTKGDGKSAGNSKAILYGVFILTVYVLLSIPFHLLDQVNPDILNEISTNVWLNLAFFVIFLVFAFSFFGYFELTIPSSWTNKISSAEEIGGIVGVFFMAITLALVSFSCTGPILGSLLAGALTADGGAWQLTAGMTGFGIALALPFTLFAMFPNWLQKIPRSGSWLNTVKVSLGFIELALALKFLSNADLVRHWGLIKLEIFLGIWIFLAFLLGLYLFGRIQFKGDSKTQKIGWIRKVLAILTIGFAAYMATGFKYDPERNTYRPLSLLSGLTPPVGYSWKYPTKCPNNIDCFNDLAEGFAYAVKQGKPVMLDFTGYACVNCRKMEEHVWPENGILGLLKEEYVLISLYVDDKKELPENEKVTVERPGGGTRNLENYGHKWAHFQTSYFNVNSQPYYVLLSPDGKTMLNRPEQYTTDAVEYKAFLECGLENYKRLNQFGSGNVLGINTQSNLP